MPEPDRLNAAAAVAPYLTVREVARRYRKSISVIWNWSQHRINKFPRPVKLGSRTTRWRLADLLEWERSMTE